MNNVEMIEQLMKDYIKEAKKPKDVKWPDWTSGCQRNKTKLRRLRLILQEEMIELERE